jgi:hypothetical protein
VRELADDAALRRRLHANGVETAARFRDVDFDRAVERLLLEAAA